MRSRKRGPLPTSPACSPQTRSPAPPFAGEVEGREDEEEEFLVPKGQLKKKAKAQEDGGDVGEDGVDCSRPPQLVKPSSEWSSAEARELLIDRFVTGSWKARQSEAEEGEEEGEGEGEEDDGGFEDLETGQVVGSMRGRWAHPDTPVACPTLTLTLTLAFTLTLTRMLALTLAIHLAPVLTPTLTLPNPPFPSSQQAGGNG